MKTDNQEIKDLKTQLFDLRLQISQSQSTKPWSLEQLEKALKTLKVEKARDPHGWLN